MTYQLCTDLAVYRPAVRPMPNVQKYNAVWRKCVPPYLIRRRLGNWAGRCLRVHV